MVVMVLLYEKNLVQYNQMTGRVQRCILIDGTVRKAPVARLWVASIFLQVMSTLYACLTQYIILF